MSHVLSRGCICFNPAITKADWNCWFLILWILLTLVTQTSQGKCLFVCVLFLQLGRIKRSKVRNVTGLHRKPSRINYLGWGRESYFFLISITGNYMVSVWRGFLFLLVLKIGCVILLWHSLCLQKIILRTYIFSSGCTLAVGPCRHTRRIHSSHWFHRLHVFHSTRHCRIFHLPDPLEETKPIR